MKLFFRVLLILIIVAVGAGVYLNSEFYIAGHSWKYGSGAHIGDWIEFDKGHFEIKGRHIFNASKEVARIKYCDGKHLVVIYLKTGEPGYYHKK